MEPRSTDRMHWGALAALAAVTFATAAIGSLANRSEPAFYQELVRPSWAPPSEVFGPVWTFLYILMAIAAWLVYRSAGPGGRQFPMSVYVVHLILNALWSWLFFAWHLGGLAFAEIVLLLTVIAMMMALFWRINRLAGMLLIPYAGWVAFATALNFALWRMNPGLL